MLKFLKSKLLRIVLLAIAFAIFVVVFILNGLDINISNGGFRNLQIGMTKLEVFKALKAQNIKVISPEVDEYIDIDANNIGSISRLIGVPAICIGDNNGFSLKLEMIDGEKYDLINFSPKATEFNQNSVWPLSFQDTMALAQQIVRAKSKVVLRNCLVDQSAFVDLNQPLETAKLRYNTWHFEQSTSYSTYQLKFKDDKLHNLMFRWRIFED